MTTFELAARGDLDAQRRMITDAFATAEEGLCPWRPAMRWALFWARVVAIRGAPEDHDRLETMLRVGLHYACEDQDIVEAGVHAVELVARLDMRASDGDDAAAVRLDQLIHHIPPILLEHADGLERVWRAREAGRARP